MKRSTKEEYTRSITRANSKLSNSASEVYWQVLAQVCNNHSLDLTGALNHAIKQHDFPFLVELADTLTEQTYPSAALHYRSHQLANLIRKYPMPGCDKHFEPEKVAFGKWVDSEARCRRMNRLFKLRTLHGRDSMAHIYGQMAHWIQYVIGSAAPLSKVWDEVGFGPGASIGVTGDATNAARKLIAEWTVSPSAFHYFYAAVMSNSFMRRAIWPEDEGFTSGRSTESDVKDLMDRIHLVTYNKVAFVPKTVKTHRSIAVEPLGNGFVQAGVGRVMRAQLKRVGIDLSDQTKNQRFAREGSRDDSPEGFVTLDLSSASDSIAIELVKRLLPPDWFAFLNALRSKTYVYNSDEAVTYEKFCSMGNGFCFPLQSLIFASACIAAGAGVPGKDFLVYGDDIIVRQKFAAEVIHILRASGFVLNKRKSFISGPFRESCGGDYFGGIDVRPYVWDGELDSVQAIFKFLNATSANPLWEGFFAPVRDFVLGRLPQSVRLWRPFTGTPDTAIDSTGDEHLTAPTVRYRENGIWQWVELKHKPLNDTVVWGLATRANRREAVEWYGCLSGAKPRAVYTYRRRSITTVCVAVGGGASCTWLPPLTP